VGAVFIDRSKAFDTIIVTTYYWLNYRRMEFKVKNWCGSQITYFAGNKIRQQYVQLGVDKS
jgi:hypothetical protein